MMTIKIISSPDLVFLRMPSFWMVGSIYAAAIAWLIMGFPPISDRIEPDWRWRVFVMVAAFPVFITISLTAWFLPESPRWLLNKGRYNEAAHELHK